MKGRAVRAKTRARLPPVPAGRSRVDRSQVDRGRQGQVPADRGLVHPSLVPAETKVPAKPAASPAVLVHPQAANTAANPVARAKAAAVLKANRVAVAVAGANPAGASGLFFPSASVCRLVSSPHQPIPICPIFVS